MKSLSSQFNLSEKYSPLRVWGHNSALNENGAQLILTGDWVPEPCISYCSTSTERKVNWMNETTFILSFSHTFSLDKEED